jgi:hypothetical protein
MCRDRVGKAASPRLRRADVFKRYKDDDSFWMGAAQRSISERISELDQQAAKIVKMQKALSEFMEDMTAENTQLRNKLTGLRDTISEWGVEAEAATTALASVDDDS